VTSCNQLRVLNVRLPWRLVALQVAARPTGHVAPHRQWRSLCAHWLRWVCAKRVPADARIINGLA